MGQWPVAMSADKAPSGLSWSAQSHDETSLPSELREQLLARYPGAKRVRLLLSIERLCGMNAPTHVGSDSR